MSTGSASLLDDALAYRDRGWSCIPIRIRGDDKEPRVRWKRHQTHLPTADELRLWFARKGINGVALIAGHVSGELAIRDFDVVPAYQLWVDTYPDLAKLLPTVRTVDGFHVYGRSDLAKVIKLDDGEYRGAGITVAPHSLRDGFRYEWINPLPAGDLPFVPHALLIGGNVAENAECHLSAFSALSATSSDLDSSVGISALSAISATCSVQEVISATKPQVQGQRNLCILALARGLKFNCGLAGTELAQLRGHVRDWHTQALEVIGTKDFDVTWADFIHAWERARHPLGLDLVDQAALLVDPEDLPECAADYASATTRQLIGLCAALASLNHSRRFFLSSHDAARRLLLEPVSAWRLLRMLECDGVLEVLERGNQHRATRYRFKADLPGKGGTGDG